MDDVAPKILESATGYINTMIRTNSKSRMLSDAVKNGTATYKEAHEYAEISGEYLSKAMDRIAFEGNLPDGKMYYNIAEKVITPLLEDNHNLISEACKVAQLNSNKKMGINLNYVKPQIDKDRVKGICDLASSTEFFSDIQAKVGTAMSNIAEHTVDESVRVNSEFHFKAGLSPKIRRTSSPGCCQWCSDVAGVYEYADVKNSGNDVFRRHENCHCIIEYYEDGKRSLVSSDDYKQKKSIEVQKARNEEIEVRSNWNQERMKVMSTLHDKGMSWGQAGAWFKKEYGGFEDTPISGYAEKMDVVIKKAKEIKV